VPNPLTFAELIDRGVLEIGDGYRAKLEELGGEGPLFLRAVSVSDGSIRYEGDRFREELRARLRGKFGHPGDVVITTKGASTGRTAFVRDDAPEFVYSPHLSFWRSRSLRELDPVFLRYWARSSSCAEQVAAMAASTDMSFYLSLVDQRRLRITIPVLSIQRAIAGVLGALDDKIELNRRMNETLEATAETLFAREFGEADEVALADEFDVTMGQSPPGDTYNELGDGLPFFQGRADFGFRFPSNRVYCTAPTRRAAAGDTLVSVRAPVGDVNMALADCAVGRGVAAVRHKSGSRSATYYAMKRLRVAFEVFQSEGTVFGSLSKKDFAKMRVARLEDGATRFETVAGPFDRRIELNERESRTLAELRDALLPKLISGELRVRDAETVVGAGAEPKRT
jgi:type I restriction enzyme, S subunit